jgi:NADPH-dependent glutamate synthase beta subunit-like oxidoreductase
MFQISLINEAPASSGRNSLPRTWAGALEPAERATHYLHLMAVPCGKCQGPVVAGWICRRDDDITQETEVTGMGAICLLCGVRPDALIDPLQACHFRPVEWGWAAEKKPAALEPEGDPLPAELSQDADRP